MEKSVFELHARAFMECAYLHFSAVGSPFRGNIEGAIDEARRLASEHMDNAEMDKGERLFREFVKKGT